MAREKKNLKGSEKLKTDLKDQKELSDRKDTQENSNEDLNDLGEAWWNGDYGVNGCVRCLRSS